MTQFRLNVAIKTLALVWMFAGCTRFPQTDDECISSIIETKINSHVEWYQGCSHDHVSCFIQDLLDHELTPEAAIQLALLNNPKVQAIFEEIGIAKADLVEAGLLTNPTVELELRYPQVKGLRTNIEYLITTSLLDLLLIPLRTSLAAAEFEQTTLKVSKEILDLAFEVRQTYFELVSERQKLYLLRSATELASINNEIISRQKSVGNVNDLEFQLSVSRLLEEELELAYSQTEVIRLTEKLNRLLGFNEDICLHLPEKLSQEIDYQSYDICALEQIGLKQRLDLQIARYEIARLSWMLGLKDWWTYTNLKGGAAGERDPDGTNLIGPGFSGELPIFNYGQAARMRLLSQLRQAKERLNFLEIVALSEIREAQKILMSYLKIINDYRNRLLPIQEKILTSSEELYNVMGLGVDKLLENKRMETIAQKNYIESIKKYLVARVELDRALGGYLYLLLPQRNCTNGD